MLVLAFQFQHLEFKPQLDMKKKTIFLPSFGTNCVFTPTLKLEKTGEWSLVTISSVHPSKFYILSKINQQI